MHLHHHWTGLPPEARGASVTMGNFDGVHRGHRALIEHARTALPGAPLGVITFEPHPRQFFAPEAPPFRLMGPATRAHRLERLGVDHLYELPFDAVLSGMEAADFIRAVLVEGLGIRHLTVGQDFHFGRRRGGDVAMLAAMGREHGFGVSALPLVGEGGVAFSSTAIRAALSEGRPEEAARSLGHWHRIDGPVIHGEKRGRVLGFPTANRALDGLHLPCFGIYAVLVDILTGPHAGESHRGAASIGVRPTFGQSAPNLETFLLDFEGDLYGAELSVALVAYIRPELAFASIEALTDRMAQDVAEVRRILA